MSSTKVARKEIAQFVNDELGIITHAYVPGNLNQLPAAFIFPSTGDGGYKGRDTTSTWCAPTTTFELRCCTKATNNELDFDALDDWTDQLLVIFQDTVSLVDGRVVKIADVKAGSDEIGSTPYFYVSATVAVA